MTTTARVTKMVASGTPRLAAASRSRLCWTRTFFSASAGAGLPGLTAVNGGSCRVVEFRGERLRAFADLTDVDARVDLREPVDQAEQTEQQGQGDRADPGPGEQQHTEGDRCQAGHEQQRTNARRLSGLKAGKELGQPTRKRPESHHEEQHERGRRGPGEGSHAGSQVDQRNQQVTNDRPGTPAAEGPNGLQPGVDKRVDREQYNKCENRDTRPGDGDDPDDDGQHAKQDQRGGRGLKHYRHSLSELLSRTTVRISPWCVSRLVRHEERAPGQYLSPIAA